jgi:hypothetical protein
MRWNGRRNLDFEVEKTNRKHRDWSENWAVELFFIFLAVLWKCSEKRGWAVDFWDVALGGQRCLLCLRGL